MLNVITAIVASLVGVWLMAAPDVLGYGGYAARSDHIVGPLVVTFGVMSAWEVTRGCRWVNIVAALWVLVAAFMYALPGRPFVLSLAAGGVLLVCSLVDGPRRRRFGGGWSALFGDSDARSSG